MEKAQDAAKAIQTNKEVKITPSLLSYTESNAESHRNLSVSGNKMSANLIWPVPFTGLTPQSVALSLGKDGVTAWGIQTGIQVKVKACVDK